MDIINTTSLTFGPLAGRVNFPGHSLTLIVKGTFDLRHQGGAELAEEQLFPTGDEFHPDDSSLQSLRYASDFVFFKPRADLLLTGCCHVPGGRPAKACQVGFRVGARELRLAVFGNRYWHGITRTISEPEPFTKMALRYENSFGGPGYPQNPVGKGYRPAHRERGDRQIPLPNIEDLDHLVTSPSSRPEPAGWGPVNRTWEQRSGLLGSYGRNWLKQRWPWFPADLDWGYFNAAPRNLQVEGYLNGDESLTFENLHPEIPAYHCRLPGIRIRCFLERRETAAPEGLPFGEVKMQLDTLWADMEHEKLVLVWRGVTEIDSDEYEDEIKHCLIVSETLGNPHRPLEYYRQQLNSILATEDAPFAEESPDDTPPQKQTSIEEKLLQAGMEIEQGLEQIRQELLAAGIDPDVEPPEPSPEDREAEARLIREYGLEQLQEEKSWNREKIIAAIAAGHSFANRDFSGCDLSGLDLSGGDFKNALFSEADLRGARFDGACLEQADFSRANLEGASLRRAEAGAADFTGAFLSRADLSEAILDEAIFAEARMHEVILDRGQCREGYFVAADLSGASLKNAHLEGADFSRSVLDRADFSCSHLKEATLEGAHGDGLVLRECELQGLRASEGCDFIRGDFSGIRAADSSWEKARLTETSFACADLERADFTAATLQHADLRAADLRQARFIKANLAFADCEVANFFEATFEKADLSGTNFSAANLYGAEFLETRLQETKFRAANLKMTKLAKTDD